MLEPINWMHVVKAHLEVMHVKDILMGGAYMYRYMHIVLRWVLHPILFIRSLTSLALMHLLVLVYVILYVHFFCWKCSCVQFFFCNVAIGMHVYLFIIGKNETPKIHDLFLKLPSKICFNVSNIMHVWYMVGY